MVRLVGVLVLRAHRRDFLATVELLRARICVHDDSQRGNHVDSLALGCVPQVLLAVCGAVPVDVLDLKFSLWCFLGGLLDTLFIYFDSGQGANGLNSIRYEFAEAHEHLSTGMGALLGDEPERRIKIKSVRRERNETEFYLEVGSRPKIAIGTKHSVSWYKINREVCLVKNDVEQNIMNQKKQRVAVAFLKIFIIKVVISARVLFRHDWRVAVATLPSAAEAACTECIINQIIFCLSFCCRHSGFWLFQASSCVDIC